MKTNTPSRTNQRETIAKIISISVPAATGVIAISAIIFAIVISANSDDNKDAIDILKYTFTALLPLWGTWLGTVLAYYFSKENFESANENVRKLVTSVSAVNEKLKGIKAKDVMIPASKFKSTSKTFDSETELKKCLITNIIAFSKKIDKNRLPVFIGKELKHLIHISVFDRFIRIMIEEGKDFKTLTFNDMLNCTDELIQNSLKNGTAFINEQANLLEAKTIMDSNTYCNDVFVTASGKNTEEVLGWITDKTINRNAQV